MMTKDIWINLPVKNVDVSKSFFAAIGFKLNERYGNNSDSASFLIGDKSFVMMLFKESIFEMFTGSKVSDTEKGAEVLFSISAESREEVNELANKVKSAGGVVFSEPAENQGWMYGFGFADLDGHLWNVLFMDINKMPKA
jgi:predicted lactoylglutathione lyase